MKYVSHNYAFSLYVSYDCNYVKHDFITASFTVILCKNSFQSYLNWFNSWPKILEMKEMCAVLIRSNSRGVDYIVDNQKELLF